MRAEELIGPERGTAPRAEADTSPEQAEPAWVQELKPLPLPYARRTRLEGDAAALFTKCVTRAYYRGGSIRDIAWRTTRSYGVVHTTLVEAKVTMRKRGGQRRPTDPTVA
ncbi:helix-turn-helix domain-containing protein [Streptomyces sp. B21-083]|uniref:helix-turn-helix domain-containing protein n=1 Tax=Streptomyces sp. B21-083 TaxID=3039410 RepID=UPI002FF05B8B